MNFGTFIGQGSVREQVIGPVNRKATPEEVEKMRALVRQGMADGAFGLSTGLFYVPGTFTPTAEVTELARVAGAMGGIHISHMREETAKVLDSVRETIEIGEKGGLPTQVTHHKIIGKANWGRTRRHAAADRRSARPRRGRDDRPVSVHGVGDRHRHRRSCRRGRSKGDRTRRSSASRMSARAPTSSPRQSNPAG